jgi:hypothetical protein
MVTRIYATSDLHKKLSKWDPYVIFLGKIFERGCSNSAHALIGRGENQAKACKSVHYLWGGGREICAHTSLYEKLKINLIL